MFKPLALLAVLFAHASTSGWAQTLSDEDAIRSIRVASNEAIANRDVPGILATLEEEYHVVASSGDAFLYSAAEMGRQFAARFAQAEDAVYVLTTETVELSDLGPFAAETGRWLGEWTTSSGPYRTGGRYMAFWRRNGTTWLIHAELYVQLFCEGADCD